MKAFENLKYRQVKTLIEICNETKTKHLEFVRSKYESISEHFDRAKDFLKDLDLLSEKNEILSTSKVLERSGNGQLSDDGLKEMLRNELLATEGPLSKHVRSYLDNFKLAGSTYSYKPLTASRLKESEIRNFLMELGLVEHNQDLGSYEIKEKHFDLFEAYLKRKTLSPHKLASILKEKDEIGKAAELAILRYERERLAKHPELLTKIEHVALNDVTAGFDILSWEIEHPQNRLVPRHIEVKAVSTTDSGFYWSRHEVEKAKQSTTRYSLYLLPVIKGGNFDTNNLEIIKNPIMHLFNNPKNWNCETETYRFSKTSKK